MFVRAPSVLHVIVVVALAGCLGACRTVADAPSRAVAEPSRMADEPSPRAEDASTTCEPGETVGGIDPCGTRKRVSLRMNVRGWRFATAIPCTLEPRHGAEHTAQRTGTCIAEGTLYVSSECEICRVPGSGWNAIAKLEELTSAQALALQTRMGLPATAALVGEKAWRQALAQAGAET